MIDPYDMPEELACGPTSPPSLQADSAESIVRALAASDPIVYMGDGGIGWSQCALCYMTDEDGPIVHDRECPWWRAHLWTDLEELAKEHLHAPGSPEAERNRKAWDALNKKERP